MKLHPLHPWNLTPREAILLQKVLAGHVQTRTPLGPCALVAGADISYNRFDALLFGAVVLWRARDGAIVETQEVMGENSFPYIPGLLSFREAPILLQAFAQLQTRPDAVMVDGQGLAHPRRFGLACHLGLWLQVPCLGCAKSRLFGKARTPGKKPGALTPLRDGDDVLGHLVRTKFDVKPLYVSAGHLLDLPSATRLVLECCRGYRLPEPTRQAHLHVNEMRRGHPG